MSIVEGSDEFSEGVIRHTDGYIRILLLCHIVILL